jgi:hypothetical protein
MNLARERKRGKDQGIYLHAWKISISREKALMQSFKRALLLETKSTISVMDP